MNIADMRTVHSREAFRSLKEHFGEKVFETVIRSSIAYAESAERATLDPRPPARPRRRTTSRWPTSCSAASGWAQPRRKLQAAARRRATRRLIRTGPPSSRVPAVRGAKVPGVSASLIA